MRRRAGPFGAGSGRIAAHAIAGATGEQADGRGAGEAELAGTDGRERGRRPGAKAERPGGARQAAEHRGPAPDAARAAALALLAGVLEEGRPLAEAEGPDDPAVRARALRLAGLVLRHHSRAERALRPHLRRLPPARVMAVLQLATVEMLADGAAPHGAVNAAVTLLRADRRLAPYAALANAVLRRVAEAGAADWAAAPPERLPKWLRGRLIAAWGSDAVAAMERAHEAGAPLDLTLREGPEGEIPVPVAGEGAEEPGPEEPPGNAAAPGAQDPSGRAEPPRSSPQPPDPDAPARAGSEPPGDEGSPAMRGWAAALAAEPLPTGSLRRRAGGRVSDLPGYAGGAWWVQDAAAALPVRGLALRPGESALDLCAAPGGKTLQMAARGAAVTAVDISDRRLARLRDNLARTGLAAQLVAADVLDWQPGRCFDAILLDAPCTATGTIRRHPDLPFLRRREDVASLAALQAAMLDRALGWLAPGGRLVFCTCSILPEEGEAQVTAALARHPGLAVDAAAFALPGVEPGWRSPEGGLRIRPDHWAERGGIDGFYMAALRFG